MNFRHPLKRNERYEINECLSLYLIDVKLCLNENYAPSSNRLQKKGGDLTFLVRCVMPIRLNSLHVVRKQHISNSAKPFIQASNFSMDKPLLNDILWLVHVLTFGKDLPLNRINSSRKIKSDLSIQNHSFGIFSTYLSVLKEGLNICSRNWLLHKRLITIATIERQCRYQLVS